MRTGDSGAARQCVLRCPNESLLILGFLLQRIRPLIGDRLWVVLLPSGLFLHRWGLLLEYMYVGLC